MAKSPSFDSHIVKTKELAQRFQTLTAALAEGLGKLPQNGDETAFAAETAKLAEVQKTKTLLEADLLASCMSVSKRTDHAYDAFDRVDEVSRFDAFLAMFRRRSGAAFKVSRSRKLAIADSLRSILTDAADIYGFVQTEKDHAAGLVPTCEQTLVRSMEQRRGVVSSMDEARQRDREVALALSTLRRKIADGQDEARLAQFKSEETETAGQHDIILQSRKQLAVEHHVLDRQAILLGDLIDVLNDMVSLYSVVSHALALEAERCFQLYDAVYGTLEPLIALAQPHSSQTSGETEPPLLGAFGTLLSLHAQGTVTMQDIEKRKTRADDALAHRRNALAQPEA
ncbi:hypothetical protein [Rhizobium sp. Leaf262]|uniref:hypothetical protein n=1 Tax=Rhizobium sp. Leaf262 TaxID=1736312 RepID=UPI000712B067|nr:hypothetical protein [Rhizobium sp. Leaf262]KQO82149.1 hypothetical protein ASF29_16490 [Rhizobium sp. Leaf262]